MLELLNSHPGIVVPLIVFASLTIVGVTTIIASYLNKARQAELRARQAEIDAALKQDMLSRGMSADDIEKVLRATASSPSKKPAERMPSRSV
jgi:hypothetical protein